MRKNLFALSILFLSFGLFSSNVYAQAFIGKKTQGGIVFYVDDTEKHGLIVDTTDMPETGWNEALTACAGLERNGYSDWRLPNVAEMEIMYKVRKRLTPFKNEYYWTSTEYDRESARIFNFQTGLTGTNVKIHGVYGYRAVRSF